MLISPRTERMYFDRPVARCKCSMNVTFSTPVITATGEYTRTCLCYAHVRSTRNRCRKFTPHSLPRGTAPSPIWSLRAVPNHTRLGVYVLRRTIFDAPGSGVKLETPPL